MYETRETAMKFVRLADGTIINAALVCYAGNIAAYGPMENFRGVYSVKFNNNSEIHVDIGPYETEEEAKKAVRADLDNIWNGLTG